MYIFENHISYVNIDILFISYLIFYKTILFKSFLYLTDSHAFFTSMSLALILKFRGVIYISIFHSMAPLFISF